MLCLMETLGVPPVLFWCYEVLHVEKFLHVGCFGETVLNLGDVFEQVDIDVVDWVFYLFAALALLLTVTWNTPELNLPGLERRSTIMILSLRFAFRNGSLPNLILILLLRCHSKRHIIIFMLLLWNAVTRICDEINFRHLLFMWKMISHKFLNLSSESSINIIYPLLNLIHPLI